MTAPGPLRDHLETPTDEARISRMWAGIRARRSGRPATAWRVGAAGVALAAAAALAWVAWPEPSAAPAPPTALALVEGGAPGLLEAHDAPARVELDDGSAIELEPDTRLETVENGGDRFTLLLARGAARFEVEPGGPRRWTVEGGAATVEVVGTVFRVDRREGGLRVEVDRGVVLVRGERVPDRLARLTRGQRLEVPATAIAAAPAPPPEPEVAPPEPEPEPTARRAPRRARPRGTVELAAPSAVAATPEDGPDAWMRRAEDAGRRGDARTQAALLRRVSQLDDDPRAALAAFTLGRIEMDRLGHPTQARAALHRALALGLPTRLAEQARARLAELEGAPPGFE